jgi:hypothetical protein
MPRRPAVSSPRPSPAFIRLRRTFFAEPGHWGTGALGHWAQGPGALGTGALGTGALGHCPRIQRAPPEILAGPASFGDALLWPLSGLPLWRGTKGAAPKMPAEAIDGAGLTALPVRTRVVTRCPPGRPGPLPLPGWRSFRSVTAPRRLMLGDSIDHQAGDTVPTTASGQPSRGIRRRRFRSAASRYTMPKPSTRRVAGPSADHGVHWQSRSTRVARLSSRKDDGDQIGRPRATSTGRATAPHRLAR